ncbi:ribosome bioproteinsis protein ytm1 [Umbelopsis nana]
MADIYIESLLSDTGGASGVPNASLNRQELDALLDAVNKKTESLEHMLFDTIKNSSDIFVTSWNSSQSSKASVEVLLQDLEALQREVYHEENGIQMVVKSALSEYNGIVDHVAENQNVIESLELLTPIVDQLKYVESKLKSGQLTEARRLLEELETTVAERFHGIHWDRVNAIHIIRKRIAIMKDGLLEALQDCINRNVTFNIQSPSGMETASIGTSITMKVNYRFNSMPQTTSGSGVSMILSDVFTSISELGFLEASMAPLKKNISRHVINALLEKSHKMWSVKVHPEGEESATLELTCTGPRDDDEVDPIATIHDVDTIFDYFYEYLFGQGVQPKEQNLLFGNLIVPSVFELMIANTLRTSVPSTIPKLNSYADVANSVRALEDKLLSYNFMASKETASLSQFVDNIDRYFSLKLKGKILVNARKVMLRKIYDAEVADDPDNSGKKFFVTQTPRLLLVLVQDTVDTAQQIAEQHPTSSAELWTAITELVDLYRALMPTFHGESYTNDYSIAMLFRNDCYWLASHLAKLQNSRSPDTKPLDTSAHKLQQLGGVWYEITVGRIVSQINHTLDRIEGFLNISQDPRLAERASQAVRDSVDLVLQFSAVVQGVLDDTLFIETITYVSDAIVSRLITDIENIHDIGEEESHIIARCLNSMMSLIDAFSRPGRPDATDSFVGDHVRDWKKFWIVRNMLEMSFRDIMELFRNGDLQCFQTTELCDLVCALFADTELRQNNLREIQQGYQSQPSWKSIDKAQPLSVAQSLSVGQQEESLWEPFDDTQAEDEPQAEGWEPFDDPLPEEQTQEEGWEPFDDDIQMEEQLPVKEQPPVEEQLPVEEPNTTNPLQTDHHTSPHDATKDDESLWEPFDHQNDVELPQADEEEGWGFDDDEMLDPPPLASTAQQTLSRHQNESSVSGMLGHMNAKPFTAKAKSDPGDDYRQSTPPRHSEPHAQEDSFASLFSGITRGTPPPNPEHRATSPSHESTFTSLLGNIIGAAPSPKPEKQAAKQSSSGIALPSFDAFGYASNRIAGEFTNVVGSMIGASPRTAHSAAPAPVDVSSKPIHQDWLKSKSATEPPQTTSKLDFVPQNLAEEGEEQDGDEEGGWDW